MKASLKVFLITLVIITSSNIYAQPEKNGVEETQSCFVTEVQGYMFEEDSRLTHSHHNPLSFCSPEFYGMESSCPVKEFKLAIYNRWGQLLFESDDIKKRWHIFAKDQPRPPHGVYVYVAKFQQEVMGEWKAYEKSGSFHILY